jgi:predicted transposase YdaD
MAKKDSLNSHDRFAAGLLQMPQHMRRLLQLLLPAELLRVMQLNRMQQCSELLLDDKLRKRQADALYRIPMLGGDQIWLYVIFEHKSWQDPLTALQLLTYMTSLMHQLLRRRQRLTAVIPIVIYHGREPWKTALTLRQLVRVPEQLLQILSLIAADSAEKSSHKSLIQDILRYISEVARPEQAGQLLAVALAGLQLDSEDGMKSALDVWKEKWRLEAIQEGLKIGPSGFCVDLV